ncbi:ATP-dependent Clp protease proteolytic subunit-related protein, chloroplastic [Raphidocelis subcapitata]|uniref:ATP-dependent Clp protease proteolytic subunit n=1 Tax=Raphidocelis subcapitata TaxID=307507 RepID=A0A2V0NPE0_9CHLO|nr:ATP-dependent Clp protease proteolytic subunit-related protein, chloroplastic [Raphidocelis subcapitata]|eukprot:GBF87370.1 ATP-dependent Clp protease proteolytic subunit-related protein, chloroplastic [Raphidocelis subcapitata]
MRQLTQRQCSSSSSSLGSARSSAFAGARVPQRPAAAASCSGRARAPGRRAVVVEARKLSHLRKKLWKEAGPPPDLATRLFSERIVYLGMPIDSSVAELITAQLFVLSQEAPEPIYFYINSTGIAKSNTKYGNEHEAIAVYSMMRAVQKFCPIFTLCVGNAFGEAALLLAAGSKGKRASLRSSTIMIRQPLQRLAGMQASDIDIYRRVTRDKTALMAKYLAASTGKTEEEVTADFARPRYFNPYEAVGYGLIDTVLEPQDGRAIGKDWDDLGSEIGNLPLYADDDQPLPTNVMYPGTSNFWRNDDFDGSGADDE